MITNRSSAANPSMSGGRALVGKKGEHVQMSGAFNTKEN